jgi:hypothetical protein
VGMLPRENEPAQPRPGFPSVQVSIPPSGPANVSVLDELVLQMMGVPVPTRADVRTVAARRALGAIRREGCSARFSQRLGRAGDEGVVAPSKLRMPPRTPETTRNASTLSDTRDSIAYARRAPSARP